MCEERSDGHRCVSVSVQGAERRAQMCVGVRVRMCEYVCASTYVRSYEYAKVRVLRTWMLYAMYDVDLK